jgi:micrococcal nuclease
MTLFKKHRGKVTRVVDGDTLDIEVDLSFRITTHQRFRLLGVDTPERGKEKCKEATQLLERLIVENSDPDGYIYLISNKTGKYGRWLLDSSPINSVLAVNYPYDEKLKSRMKKLRKDIKKGIAAELFDYEYHEELTDPLEIFYDNVLKDISDYGNEYFNDRLIV